MKPDSTQSALHDLQLRRLSPTQGSGILRRACVPCSCVRRSWRRGAWPKPVAVKSEMCLSHWGRNRQFGGYMYAIYVYQHVYIRVCIIL